MKKATKEYVLGTGSDELSRLAIQHRIWADATTASWKRAGIGPGSRVLDLGCGPGFASLDMAQLVTNSGQIVAVDESQEFLDFLKQNAEAQKISQIEVRQADAQKLSLSFKPDEKFDFVYCRWVLCWLKEPQSALEEIFKNLKPGGKLILFDYFNWKTMTTGPRSPAVEKMVMAAVSSFEDRNGNVDLCGNMLAMLRDAGLATAHFEVHQRVARGGGLDSTLSWVLTWWRTYGPKLVQMNKLSQADCEQALNDLNLVEKDPDRFFFCPPLFEFIATKN